MIYQSETEMRKAIKVLASQTFDSFGQLKINNL